MPQKLQTNRLWVYALILVLGIALGTQVGSAKPFTAEAEPPMDPMGAGLDATTVWYTLTPDNVAVFSNRIHVKATSDDDGILYWAVPTTDSRFANRMLSLLLTAKASGKRVSVKYNPSDTSGTSFGCLAGDCRTILYAYIVD